MFLTWVWGSGKVDSQPRKFSGWNLKLVSGHRGQGGIGEGGSSLPISGGGFSKQGNFIPGLYLVATGRPVDLCIPTQSES